MRRPLYDPRDPPRFEIPTPRCAACGGGYVEGVKFWFSPAREGYVVQAFCHGEVDESVVPVADILAGAKVTGAIAFARSKPEVPEDE